MFLTERYRARLAESAEDISACQRLRYLTFVEARGLGEPGHTDTDAFDAECRHMMVEEVRTGQLACCFRLLPLKDGSEISRTYSAQYYELSALADYPGRMVEMGRFCIHPAHRGAVVLRVAWAAMTDWVEREKVELLFGCSSFMGVDAEEYMDAFALLKERHLAPTRWLPRVKAPKVFRFATRLRLRRPDMKKALACMPPLLRTYLVMGGWVSDHAVIDHDLKTLHVFTGIETSRVPASRRRALRG